MVHIYNMLLDAFSIDNLLFILCGMFNDSIHLILSSTFFVLYQIFISCGNSPVVRFGHARREWPTTWWLEVLPISSACPVSPL